MITKLPRVLRLDDTDERVYERPAQPGELVVVGSFHFWDAQPDSLTDKRRQAFLHGFLGTDSFGWASIAVVSEVSPIDVELMRHRLACHLVDCFGAPDIDTALPAADDEIAFAGGLCDDHPGETMLTLRREFRGETIVESFKVVRQGESLDHGDLKIFGVDETSDHA